MAGPSLQLCVLGRFWQIPCPACCQAGRAGGLRAVWAKDWFLGSLEMATLVVLDFIFLK